MSALSRLLGSVSVVAVSLAAAGMAQAQTAPVEEPAAQGPADSMIMLSPITVFATRSPSLAFDYPGQVTVIERDRIESLQPSSVFDVFEGVPGVQVEGGARRSGQTISVRGLEGEGVLILFDGARQSFVSGHDGRAFVDPSLLKAVEVIRGPGSALYGSGALGGVVAFRTVDAADFLEPGETAGIQVGTGFQTVDDEFSTTGTIFGRTPDGAFDGVASVTYRQSGDIDLGSGLTLPSDDEILSGLLKGTAALSDGLSITGSYLGYRLDGSDPNNPQGNTIAAPNDPSLTLVDRETRSDTLQARIDYAPTGSDWIDLSIVPYYSLSSVEEPEADSDRFLLREVETLGITVDNVSRFSLTEAIGMTLTYGAEYYRDEQDGEDSDTADGGRGGVPDAQTDVVAVFIQNEVVFEELGGIPGTLTLLPALRYDSYRSEADGQPDTEDDALSPRIGVSYEPVPWLNLFANYAEGFRAPSFDELYATGVHFRIPDRSAPPGPPVFVENTFVGDPTLKPERSETIEIGAGLTFMDVLTGEDFVTARGSYYWSDVENLIDLDVNAPAGCFGAPFPPCGSGPAFDNTSTYRNVANAEIEGFELEVQYDSPRAFATASFATIDGEDADTGEPVGALFATRLYTDLGVKVPEADARIGTRLTVADALDDGGAQELSGYTTLDLYATWEPADGPLAGFRLDVGVDNVTDEDYEIVAAGVSEPGRNYRAAVSYRLAF